MNILAQYGADERRYFDFASENGLKLARVVSQHRSLYELVTETGMVPAEVSGKYRHEAAHPADYPAVGDFVLVTPANATGGQTLIQRLLPHKSVFLRRAAGSDAYTQVVAANIDVAFLCMSLNENYNISRLERYLAVAWESGARPVVVLTKADLCANPASAFAEVSAIASGAEVLLTSAINSTALALRDVLKPGVTAAFLGSSGVGKSTLINLLAGETRMEASVISGDGRGRHTTTYRQLLLLPNGGLVIDTPGMRELGIESVNLDKSFADIDTLAGECRFSDCTHTGEPGCAVREALADGRLDARRYENYQKIRREASAVTLSARGRENAKIQRMFGGKKAMKQTLDDARAKRNR